jgi:hypothetical protein
MPTEEQGALQELTRAVALALGDPGIRLKVLTDMQNSTVREHKLEFNTYLTGRLGQQLLNAAAAATGRTTSDVLELVSRIRPLEFYMPVAAHRLTWQGGREVLIAAQLEEEDTPIGFTVSGESAILSPTRAPDAPTLALVPVETDFSTQHVASSASGLLLAPRGAASFSIEPPPDCDPATESCTCTADCSPPPPPPPPQPAGIYMNSMTIRDVHEPWLRGAPELDLIFWSYVQGQYIPNGIMPTSQFVGAGQQFPWNYSGGTGYQWNYTLSFTWDPNALSRVYAACAGELAADWRKFDFNSNGTNSPPLGVALIAETNDFAHVETIRDPNRDFAIAHQRRVPLSYSFQVEVLERDDGYQCPQPPVYYELAGTASYTFRDYRQNGGYRASGWGFPDFMSIFGNNNDRVAFFVFPSVASMSALNSTFVAGQDADVVFTNYGFSAANIPSAQDPFIP